MQESVTRRDWPHLIDAARASENELSLYTTVQYSTVQCYTKVQNTVQYSTAQYNIDAV